MANLAPQPVPAQPEKTKHKWHGLAVLGATEFVCGYCNREVASNQGFYAEKTNNDPKPPRIIICPNCTSPTFFRKPQQIPGVAYGNAVEHLPSDIASLYNEARNCIAVGATTASVLACRKLLMNIAVQKGAKANQTFASYVDYLQDNHYVPAGSKAWVDHIRSKGNEANHEIALMSCDDAEELVSFAEMLLKIIYEFPNKVPIAKPKQP
jgi:hypothetical protein